MLLAACRAGLARIAAHAAPLQAIAAARPHLPPAPRFDQNWFAPLDATFAYALVRDAQPRRLVEVGAGHSTRFFARAAADGGFALRLTAIDPGANAARKLAGLAVTHHAAPLAPGHLPLFSTLEAGDVASLDGSHVMAQGSDVDLFLHHVLPALSPGVLVHIHDIFLPDPYPAAWAARGYCEQGAVAAVLERGGLRVRFASHAAATRLAAEVAAGPVGALAALSEAPPASLWLETLAR